MYCINDGWLYDSKGTIVRKNHPENKPVFKKNQLTIILGNNYIKLYNNGIPIYKESITNSIPTNLYQTSTNLYPNPANIYQTSTNLSQSLTQNSDLDNSHRSLTRNSDPDNSHRSLAQNKFLCNSVMSVEIISAYVFVILSTRKKVFYTDIFILSETGGEKHTIISTEPTVFFKKDIVIIHTRDYSECMIIYDCLIRYKNNNPNDIIKGTTKYYEWLLSQNYIIPELSNIIARYVI